MWLASRVLPEAGFDLPGRVAISAATAAVGFALCLAGILRFRQAGTTVDPRRPGQASALVTTGIYSVTRNPMYLGFLVVLVACGIFVANAVALLFGPAAFALYIDRLQIPAEERALTQAFGDEYRAYTKRVRRWI